MVDCDDLRFGGTLSDAGISGGTSVANMGITPEDYGALWGVPRWKGSTVPLTGIAGTAIATAMRPDQRSGVLVMKVHPLNALGVVTTSPGEHLDANTDTLKGLVHDPDGFLIEWDLADGSSRFIRAWILQPGAMTMPFQTRRQSLPYTATYPYWRVPAATVDTVNGADTITNGGNARDYGAILEFSGNGYFENATTGQRVTVAGSTGTVIVNCETRERTQGGLDASNLVTFTNREWMRFNPGVNTVTSTVSVGVKHRGNHV